MKSGEKRTGLVHDVIYIIDFYAILREDKCSILLIDKGMKKIVFAKNVGISATTLAKFPHSLSETIER